MKFNIFSSFHFYSFTDAYVYELNFVALEGLDYNDDLTDKSSKNYLNEAKDIQNAVSFMAVFDSYILLHKLFNDKLKIRLIK